MLRLLQRALLADHQIARLTARIHPKNAPSTRAFEGAGFRQTATSTATDFATLEWARNAGTR
jgi:RimJ/RimL family protein N-acetyltransferase